MAPPVPPVDPSVIGHARSWVREAGDLTLSWFRSGELVVDHKHDGTPVTRADHDAESLLRERIASVFPDDTVLGEEHPDLLGTSERTWVIDPIDGTHAFSHGVGTFSNLLYLQDIHGPALGIINVPVIQEMLWAARGRGCFLGDEPVRAFAGRRDDDPDLRGKVLCVSGFSEWDPDLFGRVAAAGVQVRTWGDGYGYALVASGRVDAMFDPSLEWWDLAAPMAIMGEAGATITRRDGGTDLTQPAHDGSYAHSAIASACGDHDSWVELLAPS